MRSCRSNLSATLSARPAKNQAAQRKVLQSSRLGAASGRFGNLARNIGLNPPRTVPLGKSVLDLFRRRSRQMVRYGEPPFVRRLKAAENLRIAGKGPWKGWFPFESATRLENPSVIDFIAALREVGDLKDVSRYTKGRLTGQKANENPESLKAIEAFGNLI